MPYGSGSITSSFLASALDEDEWSASRSTCFTSSEKRPRNPLDRKLSGSHSRAGHFGSEKEVASCGN
jgi:hypothetical protein